MPRTYAPICPISRCYDYGKRLYHRAPGGKGYKPIGFICPRCGYMWLDRPPVPDQDYLPSP